MRRESLIVLMSIAALAGCSDHTRIAPPIHFDPPARDLGADVPDFGPPIVADGICDEQLDGASCELLHATGVCARERCVLVACETGFADCADEPGCETSLSEREHCGACDLVCEPDQQCSTGPDGYACAAGIICPVDRFDLDDDPTNGCEWQASWESPYIVAPADLEIEAVAWVDGAPIVAGGVDDARISVRLGATPQTTTWAEPRAGATAVDVTMDPDGPRVVWSDGVSVLRSSDFVQAFATPPCEPASVPRRFVGVAGDWVATQFELFRLDRTCPELICLIPAFGRADYLSATYPVSEPDEVANCDGCSTMLPPECSGFAQCRAPGFDDTLCAGCDPSGCPTLDIVDVEPFANLLAVVSARGVVLVDPGTGLVDRAESVFDPLVAGGPRFVGALANETDLALLHSSSFIRVIDPMLTQRFPDFGVPFDPEAASIARVDDLLVAADVDGVRLIRPSPRSARTAVLDMRSAPGIQGLTAIAAVPTPEGVRVLYAAAGQLYPRLIARVPDP